MLTRKLIQLYGSANDGRITDTILDIILIVVLTALSFGLSYHPYFFGDELVFVEKALIYNYGLSSIFWDIMSYKPRIVLASILAILIHASASRLVYAILTAACMVWINVLLYFVLRNLFNAGRALSWLVIATVLTSRYGVMLYFDYLSGLVELLATALLLTGLTLAWQACRHDFKFWYALFAFVAAVACVFTHERYAAGFLVGGCVIAISETRGVLAKRRLLVLLWALCLGLVPLMLFAWANTAFGKHAITMGTSGTEVKLGWDVIWRMGTYWADVFLGFNYGPAWLWGKYNYLDPVGKIIGWGSVFCTTAMIALATSKKSVAWENLWLALGIFAISLALIMVASLPESSRQEARWMFPVGILVLIIWIIMLRGRWRHCFIVVTVVLNLALLFCGSHDFIANIYSSRTARSIAESLQCVSPLGRKGILVGDGDASWCIGEGQAFSKFNPKSELSIKRFIPGSKPDPGVFDFGLVYDKLQEKRVRSYRLVDVTTAMIIAGAMNADALPSGNVIGGEDSWEDWRWNVTPDKVGGAVMLRPGLEGWRAIPVSSLDQRLLVYHCRATKGLRSPMRLQVNWHKKGDNRFLSATIVVVLVGEEWHSYAILLSAPFGADIGFVYARLHDAPLQSQSVVELRWVELKQTGGKRLW